MLGIQEKQVVISVGQFIPRKGFEVLMKAVSHLSKNIGFYIIGGEPTEKYLQIKKELNLENIHFVGFKAKKELLLYYQVADCTAFPTVEDIWGLITNESMAFGVPVVATDRCISALEMINNGKNGYIIPVEDDMTHASKILSALNLEAHQVCIATATNFTIEKMANAHAVLLERLI